MATVVFLLSLTDSSAFRIQFQLAELSLMVGIYRLLCR